MIDEIEIEGLLSPLNLIQGMSKEKFIDWLELGTVEDIEATIIELNKCEMYEYSAICRDYLKEVRCV